MTVIKKRNTDISEKRCMADASQNTAGNAKEAISGTGNGGAEDGGR